MDNKDIFDIDFFAQKEQEPWVSEKQKGNYTPDPVFKKLYVIVAGQTYETAFKVVAATFCEHDASRLVKGAEKAVADYEAADRALRSLDLSSGSTQSKLLELTKSKLSLLGLEKSLELCDPDELYFEVQEVTAKVS